MKNFLFGLLVPFACAGCASTPTAPANMSQAPRERLLVYQGKTADASGTIVVTRDEGFGGSGCFYAVSINGTLAARLAVSETATFFVPPGEILLRAGRDPQGKGLCAIGKDEWTQRETILHQDETKRFRLSLDANGKTDIQRGDD
jgi:hypothetical protein